MFTDHYSLQRVVDKEKSQGWLILLDKEQKELGRCFMPAEVLKFHLKRGEIERDVLGLSVDQPFDLEIEIYSDLEGNVRGHVIDDQGEKRDLSGSQLSRLIKTSNKQKRIETTEKKIFGELLDGYISTLPINEEEQS